MRPGDRKEKGEYLILSPKLIIDGEINYQDERAYYYTQGSIENNRFSKAILIEGDIVLNCKPRRNPSRSNLSL